MGCEMDCRELMLISGLMLTLMQTAVCVDQICRFNESESCTAALGHKLSLQLVLDAQDQDLHLYKGLQGSGEIVFRIKDNNERKHESIRDRSEFFSYNGTLVINSVNQEDSGIYRLELYDSNGSGTFKQHLQIDIEASSASVVFVLVWCAQMMLLFGLLGGFHIYMRHTSGKKQEDQELRRFEERHEAS